MPSVLGLKPEDLLQAVLDTVGVALAVIDKAGNIAMVNQAALTMFDEKQDIKGLHFLEWRRGYKFQDSGGHEIPADEAPLLRVLAGEAMPPRDLHVILPDGRTKWLHFAGHEFSVLGLSGVLVIGVDETEHVELRRAAERLQRMQAIGVLAGGLAHDFNNMLSVISEHVSLALAENDASVTVREHLQHMALALEKGAVLARRLVQFSRTPATESRPVHVNEVVTTALELAQPLFHNRVRVTTDLARALPTVQGDQVEIEQALVNLILNALDAMPQGGDLKLCTEVAFGDDASDDKNARTPHFVLITVTDTGIGIPEHLQNTIFDPFFTTKSKDKGAGLGLSSAYGIVRHHNGHIKVRSSPGTGTTFSIYLPTGERAVPVSREAA